MNLPKAIIPERTIIDFKSSTPSRIGQVVSAIGYLKRDKEGWVVLDRNEIEVHDPTSKGHTEELRSWEQVFKCAWHFDRYSEFQAPVPQNDGVDKEIDQIFEVLKQEALEDGRAMPEQPIVDKVRHIIKEMGESPDELELDMFDDGSIGVTKHGAFGCSVMTVCKPDGTAITALSEKGEYHHLFSSSTEYRPEVLSRFLGEVLNKLEKESNDVAVRDGNQ